ncbi:MAG: sigma-70 family RNA polymerase sigma factor [Planctomycetota bacterium]
MDREHSQLLLAEVEQGSREALDRLFERDRGRLRRLLALRAGPALRQRFDLDDLVQEAHIEAVRRLDTYSYQGQDSFFRWLAVLALNRLQNLRRMVEADKRDPRREVRFGADDSAIPRPGPASAPAPGPGPRTLTSSSEEETRLLRALDQLSEVDQEVIRLARFEGRSLTEVAEAIGRSRNAVALLLSRALRKLKDRLAQADSPTRLE